MDKVKIGVVGLIRGASVIAGVVGEKNVEVTAICDKDPQVLERAYQRLRKAGAENVVCYEDYDTMLAQADMDAVYVVTYASDHVSFVVKALNAGKHVLSEIPTVATVEEVKILKDAVNSHPELKYMAGENCCYWGFIEAWKKMFEAGKFGDVVYAESEYLHSLKPEEIKPYENPNHWRRYLFAIKYLTHNLGPLLYVMDDEVVSVACMEPDTTYNPHKMGKENGVAIFKTAKGAVIRILISFGSYCKNGHRFRIMGTKGTIETGFDQTTHSFAAFDDIPGSKDAYIEIPINDESFSIPGNADGHGGADKKMVLEFIKCIVEDKQPELDVDAGIKMSLPGIIAHDSAAQGGTALEIPKF